MDSLFRWTRGLPREAEDRLTKALAARRDPRLDWVPLDLVNRARADLWARRTTV